MARSRPPIILLPVSEGYSPSHAWVDTGNERTVHVKITETTTLMGPAEVIAPELRRIADAIQLDAAVQGELTRLASSQTSYSEPF
jgi:hypothetical protein